MVKKINRKNSHESEYQVVNFFIEQSVENKLIIFESV